ncbi:ORF113 [Saltwater crocodilepox virus]|nr:ORF113 [Saltwater crocodilepox virus]
MPSTGSERGKALLHGQLRERNVYLEPKTRSKRSVLLRKSVYGRQFEATVSASRFYLPDPDDSRDFAQFRLELFTHFTRRVVLRLPGVRQPHHGRLLQTRRHHADVPARRFAVLPLTSRLAFRPPDRFNALLPFLYFCSYLVFSFFIPWHLVSSPRNAGTVTEKITG